MNKNENDNFIVKDYNSKQHYVMVKSWFDKLENGGWKPPNKEWLENGLIIEDYGAVFLHLAKTGNGKNNFGYLWPVIANVDSNIMKRDRALDILIKGIIEVATKAKCNFMYTTISNNSLIKRLNKRHNMLIAEDNMTSLILPIGLQENISLECMVDDKYADKFPENILV